MPIGVTQWAYTDNPDLRCIMRIVLNGELTQKDLYHVNICKAAWRNGLLNWLEVIHDGITVYYARRGE